MADNIGNMIKLAREEHRDRLIALANAGVLNDKQRDSLLDSFNLVMQEHTAEILTLQREVEKWKRLTAVDEI